MMEGMLIVVKVAYIYDVNIIIIIIVVIIIDGGAGGVGS